MWSRRRSSQLAISCVCILTAWLCWPQHVRSHETLTTTVLFDREIVRVLNQHCVMCHVENGPAFPLGTYEQTWVQARKIRTDVISRHMPPWYAFQGYGQFLNDNSLTLREVQFVISWVEGSGPRNAGRVFTNVADPNAPRRQEVRAQADFGHWHLGEPDLRRMLPAKTIEPGKGDVTEHSIIDLGLISERQIRGLEYMPGDRRAVRAAVFTVQETGQWLGSWTPWYGFMSSPQGSAWRLPAGAHIKSEIQYHSANQPVTDQGTLGLSFAKEPAAHIISDLVLESKGELLPGTAEQRFRAATRLTANTLAIALRPEFYPGIQSLEVSARKPDGTTEVMLFLKDIRLDWPTPYLFKVPVALPKGTDLFTAAYYSNPGTKPLPAGIRLTLSRYEASAARPTQTSSGKASHTFHGKVEAVDRESKTLRVNGEEVKGWMAAMTMNYKVDDSILLEKVKPGDQIVATVYDGDLVLHKVQLAPKSKK